RVQGPPGGGRARPRAWQQIAAIGPASATLPGRGARVPQSAPTAAVAAEAAADGAEGAAPAPAPAQGPGASPFPAEVAPIVWLSPGPRPAPVPPPRPLARAGEPGPRGRFLLWGDAVGGELGWLDDERGPAAAARAR